MNEQSMPASALAVIPDHGLDVAIIGNGRTAALVDPVGRLVWWCYPRFDGDPVFCRLLSGDEEKGFSDVVLVDGMVEYHSEYQRNTATVITTLTDRHGGKVRITDFAPRYPNYGRMYRPPQLVRMIEPVAGLPRIAIRVRPTFNYGQPVTQRSSGSNHIRYWVGDSIITRRSLDPASGSFAHVVEKVSLDGQVTKLFESSRLASYSLAHDGGSLLAADGATREGGNPVKEINVLALDGSEIRSFGALSNRTSAIFPFVWSPDGTQVAFANIRRLYVAPRVSQLDIPSGIVGVPPDSREVYVASDEFVTPFFTDLEFSRDNKFLVMQVYEGDTHFVVVSLETGQSTPLTIPHLDPFVVDDNYLGTPAFFSWRQ